MGVEVGVYSLNFYRAISQNTGPIVFAKGNIELHAVYGVNLYGITIVRCGVEVFGA
jgi:hypothetical protein